MGRGRKWATVWDKYLEQAAHEYSPKQRYLALLCLAPIFLIALPLAFLALGAALDTWLHWPPVPTSPANLILGVLLGAPGWGLALWCAERQFTLGHGTPVPLMATQHLIVEPPYTYCRNPMVLGTLLAYLGLAIGFRSLGAALLVLLFIGTLLVYVRVVEEHEMELRFGEEYLAYKRRTPFLIPLLRKRRRRRADPRQRAGRGRSASSEPERPGPTS